MNRTLIHPPFGFVLFLLFVLSPIPVAAHAEPFSNASYNELLKRFVQVDGAKSLVNYSALKAERSILDTYTRKIEQVSASEFKEWDPHTQLAFLINAYNAFTLQLVIDNYPIQSIQDAGTAEESAWKKKFFVLFGKERSLDFLENEFIRKRYNEVRIHFALVCAAISCPPLRPEAYTGKNLLSQLEDQRQKFLLDPDRNFVRSESGEVYLSKIFSWYKEDFENSIPGQKSHLLEYLAPIFSRKFNSFRAYKITYLPYDWKLNDYKE